MTSKTERLFNLVAWLLDSPRPVSLEKVRERVAGYEDSAGDAAFKRMFERDKEELRAMGIPLEYVDSGLSDDEKGYRIDRSKLFLPRIDFTADESVALALAASLVGRQADFPYGQAMASAFRKLRFEMEPEELPGEAFDLPVTLALSPDKPDAAARLDALLDALATRRTVAFSYRSASSGRAAKRRVDPYGVFYHQGAWYLVGHCHTRDEPRVFRVDRVSGKVRLALSGGEGPDYEIPADFDPTAYRARAIWELGESDAPSEARVVFSKDFAAAMRQQLAGKATVKGVADGRLQALIQVRNKAYFLSWLRGLGEVCELMEPAAWRADLARTFQHVASRHADRRGGVA